MLSLRIVLSTLAALSVVYAEPAAAANEVSTLEDRHYSTWSSRNNMSKPQWRKFRKFHKAQQLAANGASGCKEGSDDVAAKPAVLKVPARKKEPTVPAVSPKPAPVAASPKPVTPPSSPSPPAPAAPANSPPPAAKPAAEAPSTSGLNAEQAAVLKAHNDYRALHGANPLSWDAKLQVAAQAWTDRCVYEHGGGKSTGSGENIAMGYKTMSDAFKGWGPDEEADYNPSAPTYSHFTQVVWKATTKLGCGSTMCSGRNFISCIYNPAGNMYGPGGSTKYFDENVQK